MKTLVTGAKGFIGKNLIVELRNRKYDNIIEHDWDTDPSLLDEYCKEADFVFHLAGVKRPKEEAEFDNPYVESKKAGEDLLFTYSEETGAKAIVYRFQNLSGKWCRPNYNSAVATFCHNIAHDIPIQVDDPSVVINLVYRYCSKWVG